MCESARASTCLGKEERWRNAVLEEVEVSAGEEAIKAGRYDTVRFGLVILAIITTSGAFYVKVGIWRC